MGSRLALSRSWNTLARYAIAAFAALLALFARQLLDLLVHGHLPFVSFFAVVLLVAWYGGTGPAILTLILCVLGVDYWFIPPQHSLKILEATYFYSVLIFLLLGALVIVFCEIHRKSKARLETTTHELRQSRDQLEQRVQERTEYLRMLSGRLLRLQDAERRRFSRELHDSAGQLLVALDLNLARLEEGAAHNSEMAQLTAETKAMVQDLLKELRTMSYLLHPPLLDEAGLPSALRWYVDGLAKGSNLEVELDIAPDVDRFPLEVETAAFRIIQESLTNVHLHSGSKTAKVRVHRFNQTLVVIVEDQGHGMPSTGEPGTRGIVGVGLAGMRERAQQLGGTLTVVSTQKGVTVRAVLPPVPSDTVTPASLFATT